MAKDLWLEQTRPSDTNRARGLVSSRTSGARVQAKKYKPPPDLANTISAFWCGDWDLQGQAPHVTELISDANVHLVFEAGRCRVVGVWTELWRRELKDRGRVRAIKLRGGACPAFLPGSASLYSNAMTPLRDVFGELHDLPSLILQDDEAAGLTALANWARSVRKPDEKIPFATSLFDHIQNSRVTRVGELADWAGLSIRAVQRLFRSHVGASAKWVIRCTRLQEVATLVESNQAPDLAELAYKLDYSDQAHMARDFKRVTQRTIRGFERTLDHEP